MVINHYIVLLSFIILYWFKPLTYVQAQTDSPLLDPGEADIIREIAQTLGTRLKQTWTDSDDPCRSKKLPIDSGQPGETQEETINCSTSTGQNFSHITVIEFKDASLQGSLPPKLTYLTFLTKIDLTRNYLSGTLPKEWASMQQLTYISLTANRLTGEIPPDWGNFSSLTYLSLEANQLSGTIPEELGDLIKLKKLLLSSNQFVGSLPSKLANIKNLSDFRVSDNKFTGAVPEFIGSWTDLTRLEMQSSGLEGPIPPAIFELNNLTDLRISDMITGPNFVFPNLKNKSMQNLILRKLNMSGRIPADIWQTGNMIDLSFNRLEGNISSITGRIKADNTFLSGNMLTGDIPNSVLTATNNIDLSYNNFTPSSSCPNNSTLNMYRSFSSNYTTNGCPSRLSCQEYYRSLHINCGGEDVIVDNTRYEGDKAETEKGAPILNYNSRTKWGFISTGDFMDGSTGDYTLLAGNKSLMRFPDLYSTARATPLFLTYYAYCMENGNYTVNLHFAEILSSDEDLELFNRVGRRIFDIYIQEKLVLEDFNIKERANGTGKEIKESFNTTVTDNILEIRLYWAGKGTTVVPDRGIYGAIISAISVCPGFATSCNESEEKSNRPIVVGVVTSVLCLIFIILGVLYWRCYCGHKSTRERDLMGLDLQTGTFTFRQLRAATNNFDSANKIGEGGFGSVYKGQLSDGTAIAVKQLSSKSRQGNREFVNEIGMISGLQHPNLVKLFGCCAEGNQLLLVYEYMENNCLANALFGSSGSTLRLDWATRQKICAGIARGLVFLHEGSTLGIVHRDIKATNVLLDRELNAKISDFGLAKLKDDENTHISTRVAGTIGYMAPEYALWGYLTEKADVYSFGVVALEIVSGRSNASYRAQNGCVCLLELAFDLQQKGNLMELVDENLAYEFNKEEAERMIKVALLCCNATPSLRPTMIEVVSMLEEQTDIQEVISDLSIYGSDLQFQPLKNHYQRIQDQSSRGSSAQNFSSDKTSVGSSKTTAQDLYSINSESIRNLTSNP